MTSSHTERRLLPETVRGDAPARILAAAEKLFAEHGFEAVSISGIAVRAGVSKANVFHHFSSKRELYVAVLRNACRDAAERLEHLETRHDSFQECFNAYAVDMLDGMLERAQLHRLMLRELLTEDDGRQAKELAERVFGEKFARLVAILRAGQARGELRRDFDPAMAAIALIGANVFFLQSRNVLRHLPDAGAATDPQRYSALLADILLRGMLAPPAATARSTQSLLRIHRLLD